MNAIDKSLTWVVRSIMRQKILNKLKSKIQKYKETIKKLFLTSVYKSVYFVLIKNLKLLYDYDKILYFYSVDLYSLFISN